MSKRTKLRAEDAVEKIMKVFDTPARFGDVEGILMVFHGNGKRPRVALLLERKPHDPPAWFPIDDSTSEKMEQLWEEILFSYSTKELERAIKLINGTKYHVKLSIFGIIATILRKIGLKFIPVKYKIFLSAWYERNGAL